jgi:hypothetical protein
VRGIKDALGPVEGLTDTDRDAIALALDHLFQEPTRQLVEEWLDAPAPLYEGRSARALIAEGRGGDVAASLWDMVESAQA